MQNGLNHINTPRSTYYRSHFTHVAFMYCSLAFAEFDGDLSLPGVTQSTTRGVGADRQQHFAAVVLEVLQATNASFDNTASKQTSHVSVLR